MVLITCPWCADDQPVDPAELTTEFHCASCGTTAEIVDDEVELDLAA